jgi:3-oxoacyl-[acyl-carrier protein] reductase
MNLQGKTALITGGSRGIGYAIARRFKEEGANVGITARTTEELDQAASRLNEIDSGSVFAIPGDVSNDNHVNELVSDILKHYDTIDILVNNAGISGHAKLHEMPEDKFRYIMEVNLFGVYLLCNRVLPHMLDKNSGFIFNIASYAGTKGLPGSGAYGATKSGVITMSESLQREVKDNNIKVMAICPGYVYTDMAKNSGVDKEDMIQPEDIAETMLYAMRLSQSTLVQKIILERFGSI